MNKMIYNIKLKTKEEYYNNQKILSTYFLHRVFETSGRLKNFTEESQEIHYENGASRKKTKINFNKKDLSILINSEDEDELEHLKENIIF